MGKTTLANELGLRLGWVVIDKDTIKDLLLEDSLLKEQIAEDTAGRAAYEAFFKLARDFLINQHQSLILDCSTLQPFVFERAKKLATTSGAQFKVILCEVDEFTRQHRLRTRKSRLSQARAHHVPREAAKQFDALDLPSHTLKICTKDPLKKYLGKALDYVSEGEKIENGYAHTKPDNSRESLFSWLNSLKKFRVFTLIYSV